MGLFNKTLDSLRDAAFGDIRDIFKHDYMFDLMVRPIGLRQKSYVYMVEHLYRNIGNASFGYDGFGTPIGEMSNPFYNTITRVPWFISDDYKNSTSNYIDYAKNLYGATLSVENINENNTFSLSDDAAAPGVIDIKSFGNDIVYDGDANYISINPNGLRTDTHLGDVNKFHIYDTLRAAVKSNDTKNVYKYSVTESLPFYFGLKTMSIVDANVLSISSKIDKETGRIYEDSVGPLTFITGPIYNNNFGRIETLGAYDNFYESMGYKTREYFDKHLLRNKYHPGFRNGIDNNYITYNSFSKDFDTSVDGQTIRYTFNTLTNHANMVSDLDEVYVYAENEDGSYANIRRGTFNAGARVGVYSTYSNSLTSDDLLKKTNESFKAGKYGTLIARFHTGPEAIQSNDENGSDITQTAISHKYGLSHGRNLLKLNPDESQGYDNPYCRVWTYHHQYHRLKDAIRPLDYSQGDLFNAYNFKEFSADRSKWGYDDGRTRLGRFGTINKNNGLVNITPITGSDENRKVDIKNCMFSIENLAWKDMFSTDLTSRQTYQTKGLSPEQKGPFGGRIMWFPPYDLKFNEDINVRWNETSFIGRGEGIYTYTNTNRSGNLSFKILIDHPSIINYWENRGKSVTNSVDETGDPEQELLRFFAGCDMLTAKPASEPEEPQIPENEEEEQPAPNQEFIRFYVFYPNDYSGKDEKDVKFAINYLANGVGAGKERVKGRADGRTIDYSVPFSKVSLYTGTDSKPVYFGGYEIRPGKPLSLDTDAQDRQNLYIGNVKYDSESNKTHQLYVQEGDSTDTWWQRKWFYRVDRDLANELLAKENYLDTNSFGLNSNKGFESVIEFFKIEDKDRENVFSFSEVFVALGGKEEQTVLNGFYNSNRVNRFLSLIKQYGIDRIECIGRASTQGTVSNNAKLQQCRAQTISRWLKSSNIITGKCDPSRIGVVTGGTGGNAVGNTGSINDKENKLWRNTEVRIYLNKDVTEVSQNVLRESYNSEDEIDQTLEKNILTDDKKEGHGLMSFIRNKINYVRDYAENYQYNAPESVTSSNILLNLQPSAEGESTGKSRGLLGKIGSIISDSYNKAKAAAEAQQDKEDEEVKRYDNEAKFFTMLEKEEPFLHQKISDKIKYFDPAFHSVSPEGFNARLTFLQQCTRQGPTVGNSDNHSADNTANNLAFGRPPVCILRIGDFYYTKILIENLSITYDPMLWDLNTEGIGVMPMIAEINMRFIFIGGSSLAGHISRLQNALSFNYYANTEVYDDRAELAKYDDAGNIIDFAPFNTRKR